MTSPAKPADAATDLTAPAEGIAPRAAVKEASTRRGRYEFLDALRGVAAMAVVVQHALELVSPAWARFSLSYFRFGEFGVVLFFLCSGFIIPASLERHGSQARFWIGRFFRLYPMYWVALAAVLVLHYGFGRYPLEPGFLDHALVATAANATMVQDFLGVSLALGQSWSLAYEVVFYGIVAVLFIAGLHRRSVPIALAGFAVAAATLTARVPSHPLAHMGPKMSAALVLTTLAAALAVAWLARGAGSLRWLAVAIVVVAIPLVFNRHESLRGALFFFATLFTGTALYRWAAGQLRTPVMAALLGAAVAAIVTINLTLNFDAGPGTNLGRAEIFTLLGAYCVFVVALAVRDVHFPRALMYLGTISYSLYLTHSIVMYGLGGVAHNRPLTVSVWVALTIVTSGLTYRFVERPAIDVGHRLGARHSR